MSLPEPTQPLRRVLRLVDVLSRIVPVRLRDEWRRIGVLVGAGLVVGVATAVAVERTADGRLFGVDALDPALYLTVVVGFVLLAAAAFWLPARRALAVEALRDE